jgi:hypothetical protein
MHAPFTFRNIGCTIGLPDGFFQTKNPNLGKFWRAFEEKMLIFSGLLEYFMVIWDIL